MGKRGTKRKTQWRSLSITEHDEQNSSSVGISEHQQQQHEADLCNGRNLNIDEGSVGSVDDNFNCSRTNYLYLKRKSSSLSSSSNYNNNRNSNNNDYPYNYPNYYYNKHNSSLATTNPTTANNNDTITTTNNNPQINHSNFSASHRYSYKRKPYSTQQNGSNGSSKYYSSYGAGRATSRPNRQLYKFDDDTTTTNNKENLTKSIFNEDEYTRITTPRQDVIFKKGFFSKPKPFLCSTDTNTTSSASASVVSNDESISALSMPSSLSPEQCSSSQSDSMFDQEQSLMYSYVDQNGIIYVNPYMPNGFDQYPPGQMIMLPYGYPPYNYYPSDLNTPPLIEDINTDNQTNNEQNEHTSENVSNTDLNKETLKSTDENPETNSVDSNDSTTSCCEDVIKDQKSDKSDEPILRSPQYDDHIVNHYGPDFINYGYNNQFYPPVFYPVQMLNGQPFLPVVGSGYEASSECMDEDSDDKDNHSNVRSQRPIDRNSTGATTTDYSEDEDSDDKENVIGKVDSPREILPRIKNLQEENEKPLAQEIKINPLIKNIELCDNIVCKGESSSNTEETESKIIKLNTNVEEFIPKVSKPHLNVNVREFQPRNYHNSKDRVSQEMKKDDEININTDVQQAKNNCPRRPSENNDVRGKPITKKITSRKPDKLTLAETIKQTLEEPVEKRKTPVGSSIINRNSSQTQDNSKKKITQILKGKVNKSTSKAKGAKEQIELKFLSLANAENELNNGGELSSKQNVLSYAQILNKDLLKDSATKDDISTDQLTNTTYDDIDVQILIQSIEAAEQSTANSIEEKKTCWQTVKRGKRGKQTKEIADIGFDDVEFVFLKEDTLKDNIEKSKSLLPETPLPEEEKLAAVEEQIVSLEKDKVISIEKKKTKSRKKKIAKKTPHSINKLTNLKPNEVDLIEHQKTDFDADPDKLARQLFEDLEQEIDLSLKVDSAEDDSENILNELYSPNSGLIRKSYGLNPLEIRNSFDKKLPSGILKEEEEMVLNVIKSLSSTPATNSSAQNNLFNMSFLQEICKKQEEPKANENEETIPGKNTLKNQVIENGAYKENPENEQCAKYIQNCIKESYKYITQKNDLNKNNEESEFSENHSDRKEFNIQSDSENIVEVDKITATIVQSQQPCDKTDELIDDNIIAINSSFDGIQIEIEKTSELSGVENNNVSCLSLHNENEIEVAQTQNENVIMCDLKNYDKESEKGEYMKLNGNENFINEKIEYPDNDEKVLDSSSDAFTYGHKECNENVSPGSIINAETVGSDVNNECNLNKVDEASNAKQMEAMRLNVHNPNECNKIYSNVTENIANCSQYFSESCEELNKDSSCNQNVLERQDSNISLEMQLKSLEEQLKKFDNIQTNPTSDYDNGCPVIESSIQSVYEDDKIGNNSVTNLLSNCCEEETKVVQLNESHNISTTSDLNNSNPNFSMQADSTENYQFPLTEAVKLWLVNESKERTPEPLLRLPDDPLLSSVIRSTLEKKTQHYYYDHEEEWSTNDDEVYDNDPNDHQHDDDEIENKNEQINNKTTEQELKIENKASKNLNSNPLHVSFVRNSDNHMDTDSDYNSDGQIKYDDDDNTCERVAMKNFSDLTSMKDICNQKQNDLLEFWDDEFIENPQKWLSPKNANRLNKNIIEKIKYPVNANQLLASNSASASDQLKPYESLYGKTVNYDQLLAKYQYLSNNVTNKNYKNDTLLLNNNNNNNNHFDNNISNKNDKENCLKPPEICCILM